LESPHELDRGGLGGGYGTDAHTGTGNAALTLIAGAGNLTR
jgi:hypothetical protein